jgi:NAD(P)H-dependent flavin oxidoreductase YrpB (nitropropane dioxygenase family)
MHNMKKLILSVFIFTFGFATATHAQQVNTLLTKQLPEAPGKEIEVITVNYAPGTVDTIHRHDAVDIVKLPVIAAGGIPDGRGLAAAFALGAEGVQIGTAFLPCTGSGASEAYRSALSSFAANGTDLTDTFPCRLARGIRNRLVNQFKDVSTPPLPFPVQHAVTQTVVTRASTQGALELMTIWAGQNASLCHSTDATEFMTELVTEAETVFSKYWEAVSPVREDEAR